MNTKNVTYIDPDHTWTTSVCFFFYQTIVITFLRSKTNKIKTFFFFKETADKTLHYLIAICDIKAVRDYKKYRYISLFQILQMYLILLELLLILGIN